MSAAVAMIEALEAEGLSAEAIIRVLKRADQKNDRTNAERQARHRAKKASNTVTVTLDKGSNERDNLTSQAEGSEPTGSSPQPRAWSLPIGVSFQVWSDFLANRKRKRLTNSPTAWKGFNDDLQRISLQTGIPPPKLIEHAAAKGWGSINVPDEDYGNGRRTNGMGRNQPSSDGLSSTARAAIAVFGPD